MGVVHLDLAAGPLGDPPAGPGRSPCCGGATCRSARSARRPGRRAAPAPRTAWPLAVAEAIAPGGGRRGCARGRAAAGCRGCGATPAARRRHRRPAGRRRHAGRPGRPARRPRWPKDAADLTVVVCTRDRPGRLARTLAALAAQEAPPAEVVVVDNDPRRERRPRPVVGRPVPAVRYVAEPRPGLSVARNTGLRARRAPSSWPSPTTTPSPTRRGRASWPMPSAADDGPARGDGPGPAGGRSTSPAARAFEFEMGGFWQGYLPRRYDPTGSRRVRWRATPVWKVGAGRRHGVPARGVRRGRRVRRAPRRRRGRLQRGQRALVPPARRRPHRASTSRRRSWSTTTGPTTRRCGGRPGRYIEGHVAALFVQYARHRHLGELAAGAGQPAAFLGVQATALVTGRGAAGGRLRAELEGYRRGLRHRRLALRPEAPPVVVPPAPGAGVRPAPRRSFLAANPFPRPLTEGFFFREKMRAIHRVTPPTPVAPGAGGRRRHERRSPPGCFPGATVVAVDLDPGVANPVLAATGTPFVAADAVAAAVPGRGLRRRHALRRARAHARRRPRRRGRGPPGRASRRPRAGQLAQRALALPVLPARSALCPDRRGRDGRVGPRPPRLPARAAGRAVRPAPDGVRPRSSPR